jgi:hypothetical protein
MTTKITSDNFSLVAARSYKKRFCLTTKSFFVDMNALELKSDLTRYFTVREPRSIRIIINKMITASNLFGPESVELVLFRLDGEYLNLAKHIYYALGILIEDLVVDDQLYRKIQDALSKV